MVYVIFVRLRYVSTPIYIEILHYEPAGAPKARVDSVKYLTGRSLIP